MLERMAIALFFEILWKPRSPGWIFQNKLLRLHTPTPGFVEIGEEIWSNREEAAALCVVVSGVVEVTYTFEDGTWSSVREGAGYTCGALGVVNPECSGLAKRVANSAAYGNSVLPAAACYMFSREALDAVLPECQTGLQLQAAQEVLEAASQQSEVPEVQVGTDDTSDASSRCVSMGMLD